MGWGIKAAAMPLGLRESGRLADLRHGDRHRRAGGHAAGLLDQRGRDGTTWEGHDQHGHRGSGGCEGQGPADGQLEQLAIADRPSSAAMAAPIGGEDFNRPAQLMRGTADGAISAAGSAMEKPMHDLAAGAGQQGGCDLLRGPEQIAPTTGDHHSTSADGPQRGDHGRCQQWPNRTRAQCSGLCHHARV